RWLDLLARLLDSLSQLVGQKLIIQSGGFGQTGVRRSQVDPARDAARWHDAGATRSGQRCPAHPHENIHGAEQTSAPTDAVERCRYGATQDSNLECAAIWTEDF